RDRQQVAEPDQDRGRSLSPRAPLHARPGAEVARQTSGPPPKRRDLSETPQLNSVISFREITGSVGPFVSRPPRLPCRAVVIGDRRLPANARRQLCGEVPL